MTEERAPCTGILTRMGRSTAGKEEHEGNEGHEEGQQHSLKAQSTDPSAAILHQQLQFFMSFMPVLSFLFRLLGRPAS